jgi:hypothetical protein
MTSRLASPTAQGRPCPPARRRPFRPFALSLSAALVVTAAVVPALPAGAEGQEEPEFKNLKVLPADVQRPELIGTMRGFALGLGVRCQHCHVGEEGQPLSEFDFASDVKPAKRQARVMLELVQRINSQVLPEVAAAGGEAAAHSPTLQVTCVTCHHGKLRPEALQQALLAAHAEGGAVAAVERYRELRERYYGGWAYDFGERSLLEAAQELSQGGDPAAALTLVDLNLEYFPQSAFSHFVRGELLRESGDGEAAQAAYRRALELNPELRPAQHRLQELAAPPEPAPEGEAGGVPEGG